MPTHQSQSFLRATIDALQRQTFEDFECLLVDDASTDESPEIARAICKRDRRFKHTQMHQNGGAARARNTGLALAKGRFVAFCDSDDRWLDRKLEEQLRFMRGTDAPITFTAYTRIGENVRQVVPAADKVTYSDLLHTCPIGFSTSIVDREKVGVFSQPEIIRRNDYAMWIQIFQRGFFARGLNEPLVEYNVRRTSLSANKALAALYHWKVLRSYACLNPLQAAPYFISYAITNIRRRVGPHRVSPR